MISQEETWALSILTATAQNQQAELQRVIAARESYIKLLEDKYQAEFDQQTGQFKKRQKKVNIKG